MSDNRHVRKGAEIADKEGKKIGKLTDTDNESLTVQKKGLLVDEEYHIPASALEKSTAATGDSKKTARVNLNERQLKHGREFKKGKPNSYLVHGHRDSEKKLSLPIEKQTIRYQAMQPVVVDADAAAKGSNPSSRGSAYYTERLPNDSEYLCDQCTSKFGDSGSLQIHRKEIHKAATNI